MKKQPKVSIVIPVYNGSNYVKDAIDSALAQTYSNIEIIVVNDGSNDDGKTRKIAESYGNKIRYFEKENGGVSTALNFAIEKMTGDYFSWLSHDDMYFPNKVECEVEYLKKYDENTILYSNFTLVDKDGNYMSTVILDHKLLTEKPAYAVLRCAIGGITLLIPKKAFKECGTFDTSLRCVQDYELWFQFLKKYKFVHLTEVLAKTRIHSMQDSNKHPKMISEGNWLWTHIADDFPKTEKEKCEGSEYLFYVEMANFLEMGTPYTEAVEHMKQKSETLKAEQQKLLKKQKVTIVIEGTDKERKKDTVAALKNQNIKSEVLFLSTNEAKEKQDIIEMTTSNYIAFLQAGTIPKDNWLEEQILHLLLSGKGMTYSDVNQEIIDSLTNNVSLFGEIAMDSVLVDLGKLKQSKIKYINDMQWLYEINKKIQSVANRENYFWKIIIDNGSYERNLQLLEIYLKEEKRESDIVATLCYKVTCSYNDETKSNKKVYLSHNCAKYDELLNSRSFKLYLKFIDFKKKLRKQK